MVRAVFVLFLFFLFSSAKSQQFYRFRADISVKDKLANGKYRLTMGKVYYDKIYKKIVYTLTFPEKEHLILQDTSMYKIDPVTNTIKETGQSFIFPDFTVFHLALTGKLSDYGLTSGQETTPIYKIGKVDKVDGGVLTTWVPSNERFASLFGNIEMLKKNRRLDAMVFYDKTGKLVSRQFFKKYVNVKGVEFPTEVTMISYGVKNEQNLQQTTYKNIVIDQQDEDEIYRYRIPVTRSAAVRKKQ